MKLEIPFAFKQRKADPLVPPCVRGPMVKTGALQDPMLRSADPSGLEWMREGT